MDNRAFGFRPNNPKIQQSIYPSMRICCHVNAELSSCAAGWRLAVREAAAARVRQRNNSPSRSRRRIAGQSHRAAGGCCRERSAGPVAGRMVGLCAWFHRIGAWPQIAPQGRQTSRFQTGRRVETVGISHGIFGERPKAEGRMKKNGHGHPAAFSSPGILDSSFKLSCLGTKFTWRQIRMTPRFARKGHLNC